jgi:DNA topoisomerase-1
VRDLPKSTLGVDIENDFKPKYINMRAKSAVIKDLKEAVKNSDEVVLATDPDREGEAIAWHLVEAIGLGATPYRRVVFHEITKDAIDKAFKAPRDLNMDLINAQQARRVLDRLVGYKLSPLLWRKVRRGLSAGRVQSVALRIIVDREREIESFIAVEYWTIEGEFSPKNKPGEKFKAGLIGVGCKKKISIPNAETAETIVLDLKTAEHKVDSITEKPASRRPSPPFITSTLQQEAWRKLKFSAKQTMALAQQLYEGLSVGEEGNVGLITYMRTDSTHIAQSALADTRKFIGEQYGEAYLPKTARHYSKKIKGAQEAHEAIRPTDVKRTPERLKPYLEPNQLKLYRLIWQRMVTSQMADARFLNTTVDIVSFGTKSKEKYIFRTQSSLNVFDGFMVLYTEGKDDDIEQNTAKIPDLKDGEALNLTDIVKDQKFTQPPPRYTEATLIKTLEQFGIGRPSTYAPILSVVQQRDYVEKTKGVFKPTELGMIIRDILVQQFPEVIDAGFTAQMEESLDKVAEEGYNWVTVINDFYTPFNNDLEAAQAQLEKVPLPVEESEETCPKCHQAKLLIKIGRYGKYMECPDCQFRQSFRIRTGVMCPDCPENAEIIGRYSKKGKLFYGCEAFPKHKFAINARPVAVPCPECGGLQAEYNNKRIKCTNKTCKNAK